MQTTNDSIDLYALWKKDEPCRLSSAPLLNAIPLRIDTSKFLVPTFGSVLFTDGYSSLKEDKRYERTLFDEEMEVPTIGTEKKNFEVAEMITFDILGSSTHLPLMCKMIIYQQGATHEREPPVLVRDVCIQWDGIDRARSNSVDCLTSKTNGQYADGLQRARSSDYLLDYSYGRFSNQYRHEADRCLSMNSSMTDDDDASSIMTAGGTMRHRISHLLHRHKYLRQIDTNLVGRQEFYSVPFYQYRGRRYGQHHRQTQINDIDFHRFLHSSSIERQSNNYSVTIILFVKSHQTSSNDSSTNMTMLHVNIPQDSTMQHTTVGYINTRQYVTIHRTINGQPIDV
jgi:hypothetical protein